MRNEINLVDGMNQLRRLLKERELVGYEPEAPLPRPKSNPIDFINFLFLCLAPSAISLKEDEQTHLLFFSLATQLIKEWKEEKELMSLMSVKPITHYAVMKN